MESVTSRDILFVLRTPKYLRSSTPPQDVVLPSVRATLPAAFDSRSCRKNIVAKASLLLLVFGGTSGNRTRACEFCRLMCYHFTIVPNAVMSNIRCCSYLILLNRDWFPTLQIVPDFLVKVNRFAGGFFRLGRWQSRKKE